jgi:cytoplasmic iron level regulating protein YaaA (DUF328/UPF0246 family)
MLIVLSPAKTLDYDTPPHVETATEPRFVTQSGQLIDVLRQKSPQDIAALMDLSDKLALLNVERYARWSSQFTPANSKQAVLAFDGDVYDGLSAPTLSAGDLAWAQDRVRILSGLYGVLRPLDRMQPYRLEMGTALPNPSGRDLYAFWGDCIAESLNADCGDDPAPVLVNLASEEYFKAVAPAVLKARVVTPVFEDEKAGKHKIISFYAKKARGLMARWAVRHRVDDVQMLRHFDSAGYAFAPEVSGADRWVFRRGEAAAKAAAG